ncbi:hypothetical protein SSRG_01068 [Streptomyces griseoflavus Tu4000]|uniref:Uncharacterized protein n=1 Tax=Streptomyces griseoflavus Tu4000 TaxID=467200 RepID=D9XU65_9ACTN|nr:hypothetical protein SSRG_01068 [Streptomyces griseoflavus Tu4000]
MATAGRAGAWWARLALLALAAGVLVPLPAAPCSAGSGALWVRVPRAVRGTRWGTGAPDWLRVTRLARGRQDDGP